jgi:regulator of telomere elongation helicase 1
MEKNSKKHTIAYDNSEIRKIKIDMEKKSKQTKIIIQNIEIYFPYQPYESQILYMTKGIFEINKVIEALDNKSIAALESPTGTGKTLCLLCASLAWLQAKRQSLLNSNEKRDLNFSPPIIYYSTRTHSQISNVF